MINLHVEFDITNLKAFDGLYFNYKSADNLCSIVRNDYKKVDKLCKRLNINKKNIINISPADKNDNLNLPVPTITTFENIFLWYLDIQSPINNKILIYYHNLLMMKMKKMKYRDF